MLGMETLMSLGSLDHELRNREIIERHDPNSIISERRDVGTAHYPLLGPYDSNDEQVILTHLLVNLIYLIQQL